MRICICATRIPFAAGGAESLVAALRDQLVARGHEVELVAVPFSWTPRRQLLKSAFAWRLLDLAAPPERPIDLVIATRFPSYLIPHPAKVVWLIHQFRQVYDLLGTRYSDFDDGPQDRSVARMVRAMDGRALAEARGLYSISRTTAERVRRFNDLECRPLPPPSPHDAALRPGPFEDYVFTAGRLDALKRFDLLVEAMRHVRTPVRCRIAGSGPEADALAARVARHGLGERVELLGRVDDDELARLYARALGVYYAPYDEDYGFVTVEAFRAGKPVLTATDSGGVLEFVEHGESGLVVPPDAPRQLAEAIDRLYRDRELAARMGRAGRRRVAELSWDRVVDTLTRHAR